MLKTTVDVDTAEASRMLHTLAKQLPFASALTMTRLANDSRDALRKEIVRVFDRPTAFTLKARMSLPAKVNGAGAVVKLRDEAFKGTPPSTPPSKYLQAQLDGGPRRLKRFERALQARGLMPKGTYAVPGAGARLNSAGNMTMGSITSLLSQLSASPDPFQNINRAKKKAGVFVRRIGVGKKAVGVYRRVGRAITPVLVFVSEPAYRPRFDMLGITKNTVNTNAQDRFTQAIRQALSTAKVR